MTISQHDVDNWFTYHAPTTDQAERYARIRAAARDFAVTVLVCTPECADQIAALRTLRDVVMQANQAIACNEPGLDRWKT